ncbi:hypothetical protein [Arcanobacterium phocae]|uniref:hypothetical protein n=1 Tax=Arcanobacterium phocae TaxID=131112 RepID=UPI0020A21440|nr:hypothetical protein [Arcanobacterium phocae]
MAEMRRNLDHLYVQGYVKAKDFHRVAGRSNRQLRQVNRSAHGIKLKSAAERVFSSSDQKLADTMLSGKDLATGTVIVLEGESAMNPLKIDSLNSYASGKTRKPKWLLLSVHEARDDMPETATVWVSDTYREKFLGLFEEYLTKNTKAGRPKNQDLVANISCIREAVLDDLWTSGVQPLKSGLHWWEL